MIMWKLSHILVCGALCSLLCAVSPNPVFADAMSLADILKSLAGIEVTDIAETTEATTIDFVSSDGPIRIRGGGALVLCEKGKLGIAGSNGQCSETNNMWADDTGKGQISDVLGFPVGKTQITLYSEPTDPVKLVDPDSLKNAFSTNPDNAFLAYVEEGTFFDELTGEIIPVSDPDVTVYVRRASGFSRTFVVRSDTTETETPEPSSLVLLLDTGCFGLMALAVKRWHKYSDPRDSES